MYASSKKHFMGLNKAHMLRHTQLRNVFHSIGFFNSQSNTPFSIYFYGNVIIYLLVYIDDLILTLC